MMVCQVAKATWALLKKQVPQDSKETMAPREFQALRGPLALLGKSVPQETPEFQVSQELRAPWVTPAMRVLQEKRGPRVHQDQQTLWPILDLAV